MVGKRVSVVMPTIDRPSMRRAAIDSVLAQSVSEFELIVVFDGVEVDRELPDDGRIIALSTGSEPCGPAHARNLGLRRASGTHLAFLDDDDRWTTDRLAVGLAAADAAPIVVTFSRFASETSGGGRMLSGHVEDKILDSFTPCLGAVLVDKNAMLEFDETWRAVEDVEWWLRMAGHHRVTTASHVTHVVRQRDEPRPKDVCWSRVAENLALVAAYPDYFSAHPRATAFRLRRAAVYAQSVGHTTLARRLHRRSFAARPDSRGLWHVARSHAWRR